MSARSEDSTPFDLLAILDALEGVDFVVVGGVAAALHGSPRVTVDLDIVPDTGESNIERLARALVGLRAIVRDPARREIPVSLQLLTDTAASTAGGQLRCQTLHGPIDILWRLHDGRGYRELASNTTLLSDDERTLSVIGIDALIEIKKAAGRPQDHQDVQYLRIIRARSRT